MHARKGLLEIPDSASGLVCDSSSKCNGGVIADLAKRLFDAGRRPDGFTSAGQLCVEIGNFCWIALDVEQFL